jgi:hypothetical protein
VLSLSQTELPSLSIWLFPEVPSAGFSEKLPPVPVPVPEGTSVGLGGTTPFSAI